MTIRDMAKICHEVNAAYCESLGDFSQPAWENAGEAHQNSVISRVQAHLDDPDLTPQGSHENWLEIKNSEGWVLGSEKNAEADPPTHPGLLAFEGLPIEQQSKNFIFKQIVNSLGHFVEQPEKG